MKLLTPKRHDRGYCRLYVRDECGKNYVILDQGEHYGKHYPRFELHTHTKDGEPDTPIHSDWQLTAGVDGSDFKSGLMG